MEYPLNKYRYYFHTRKDGCVETIAISTYAGKEVRGKSICLPSDGYNKDKGMELAAYRCNAKIAKKRYERAVRKEEEAYAEVEKALAHYNNMREYRADSAFAWQRAEDEMNDVYGNMVEE